MQQTRAGINDYDQEIRALTQFLQADEQQWAQLVPQMLAAEGTSRLQDIVQTAGKRVGRFEKVIDSRQGLVIVGDRSRVLAWVHLDEHGELTNLLVGAHRPSRLPERARLLGGMAIFLLMVSGTDCVAWSTHSGHIILIAAFWALAWILPIETGGSPAALPWWFRRPFQIGVAGAVVALVRLPGLSFGNHDLTGLVIGFGYVLWMSGVKFRDRRHRWGVTTTAALSLPVRGRWYVYNGGGASLNPHAEGPIAQRGAVDLMQVRWQGSWRGRGRDLGSFFSFGQNVYAPCAGTVIEAVDGLIDQVPWAPRFAGVDQHVVALDRGFLPPHVRAARPVDQVAVHHLVGGSGADHVPRVEEDEVVAVTGGQVEVVQHDHRAGFQVLDESEDVVLVADVQVVGGFIEEQVVGFLGEGPGDQDTLFLAAGQAGEAAGSEVDGADAVQRLPGDLVVLGAHPGEGAKWGPRPSRTISATVSVVSPPFSCTTTARCWAIWRGVRSLRERPSTVTCPEAGVREP